jgi:putative addiction module antidote
MYKLKIIQIGNSLGVTLPKEMLAGMNVDKGATLTATPGPDGYRLTPNDPEIEKQIEAGREFMRDYRDTLRALAK